MFVILLFCCVVFSLGSITKIPLKTWNLSDKLGKLGLPNDVKVSVPSTIIGGLVESKAPGFDFDPFYGKNLDLIKESWFLTPWVYETHVEIEEAVDNERFILCFDGLNYKADVWVNDVQVGFKKDLVGVFRHFQMDVTNVGKRKILKNSFVEAAKTVFKIRVEINRANDFSFPWSNNSTDLAITFVDWNPHPPDYSMGLFRPVYILRIEDSDSEPALTMEGHVVQAKLSEDYKKATLSVSYVVKNWKQKTLPEPKFYASLGISGVSVLEKIIPNLPSGESVRVEFDPIEIDIDNAANMLWWPWQMGNPNMFKLTSGFVNDKNKIAYSFSNYGIREITSKLSKYNFLQFYVNKKPLLIRAAGWTPDMFLRTDYTSSDQLRDQFMLVRDMNLNAIRLEGKMESDLFWDLADEFGILTIPGWCCCDAWQHWKFWNEEDYVVAEDSMRTQVRRLGIHPNILAFMYSSDDLPPANVEKMYLNVFNKEKWPNPTIASGSEFNSSLTGPTGVKMSGPYSWVPPIYWLEDNSYTHKLGGAYGFLTEGGPGESPLTYRSWKRTVPKEHVWEEEEGSMSSWWDYHCGNPDGIFKNLRFFTPPLNSRYGEGKSASDYLYKAQAMSYEGIRSFYESYARNRHRNSTGLVQWMLNNAWPEHVWHLYDSYFSAGAGYYATKRANEPLHVMLSYTDGSVWIMNQVFSSIESTIFIRAEIFDLSGSVVWEKEVNISRLDEDASIPVPNLLVPLDGLGKFQKNDTFFVRLIWECQGKHWNNDYWISPTMDILNWKDTQYWRTGCSQFANFKQLQELKPVQLKTNVLKLKGKVQVEVMNPVESDNIAFFIEVIAMDSTNPGIDITPVFWTDNWFTLKPGESRIVETALPSGVESENIDIVIDFWNDVVCGKQ